MWICQQCGLENTHDRVVCKDCDGIRAHEVRDAENSEYLEELFFDGMGI
jgi:hypothetical protein